MKRKVPRQRPQQRAANSTARRTVPGYRRRGDKTGVERGWRSTFSGLHDLNLLPGRRASRDAPKRPADRRSGCAKRRARGHRHDPLAFETGLMRDEVARGIPQATVFAIHGWEQLAPGHWRRKDGTT